MAAKQIRYAPVPSTAQTTHHTPTNQISDADDTTPERDDESNIITHISSIHDRGTLKSETIDRLPPYDRALGTRNACIAGLLFSFAVSITCISLAPWAFRGRRAFLSPSGGYSECAIPAHLLVTILIVRLRSQRQTRRAHVFSGFCRAATRQAGRQRRNYHLY